MSSPIPAPAPPAELGTIEKPQWQVIHWSDALKQVGGDQEFLDEVLLDLITEAQTAEDSMLAAIQAADFDALMNAAHRVKGSASYLCCEVMREVSLELRISGHAGMTSATPEIDWNKIKEQYRRFVVSFVDLKAAIAKHASESSDNLAL